MNNAHKTTLTATVSTALIGLLLVACGDSDVQSVEIAQAEPEVQSSEVDAQTLQAQAAITSFATALKAELTAAMQQGGPVNAIQICNTSAPAITQKVSVANGVTLSRVSLRNRNPDNQPLDWQSPVLLSFEQRRAAGADLNSLDWSETITLDGKQEYRYMKAIPTGGLCLQCHGTVIAPQVAEAIADLYPDDRATGYSEGQIRGAFVVTQK